MKRRSKPKSEELNFDVLIRELPWHNQDHNV